MPWISFLYEEKEMQENIVFQVCNCGLSRRIKTRKYLHLSEEMNVCYNPNIKSLLNGHGGQFVKPSPSQRIKVISSMCFSLVLFL